MALEVSWKTDVVTKFARFEGDTGSPEVQVGLLTTRIRALTEHFKAHGKDHHSRQGLFKMIGRAPDLRDPDHLMDLRATIADVNSNRTKWTAEVFSSFSRSRSSSAIA